MAVGEPVDGSERLVKALGLAAAHLNRRERTEAELRAHLERKGIDGDISEAVVAELVETGAVDDSRYAEMFVADKRTLEEWGDERIRRGLLQRGIDRDLVERALAEPGGASDRAPTEPVDGLPPVPGAPVSELDRALGLLRRRFPKPPRERRDRERALGMLLRKGYGSELALDALSAHAHGD